MRYLTTMPVAAHSRCTSLAAAFRASNKVECTKRTTGLASCAIDDSDRSPTVVDAIRMPSTPGMAPSMALTVSSILAKYATRSSGCARHQRGRPGRQASIRPCSARSNGFCVTQTMSARRSEALATRLLLATAFAWLQTEKSGSSPCSASMSSTSIPSAAPSQSRHRASDSRNSSASNVQRLASAWPACWRSLASSSVSRVSGAMFIGCCSQAGRWAGTSG